MKVRELNEMSLTGVKSIFKKIADTLKDEHVDNKIAFGHFKDKLTGKEVSKENLKKSFDQMADNGRMVLMGAVGAAPGSVVTLPLLLKIADKLNIRITPEKTFKDKKPD